MRDGRKPQGWTLYVPGEEGDGIDGWVPLSGPYTVWDDVERAGFKAVFAKHRVCQVHDGEHFLHGLFEWTSQGPRIPPCPIDRARVKRVTKNGILTFALYLRLRETDELAAGLTEAAGTPAYDA
jgi:hypothetical protein